MTVPVFYRSLSLASAIAVLGVVFLTNGTAEEPQGFVSIFDGETLRGWRAAPEGTGEAWSVRDGAIRGEGRENRLVYLVYGDDENLRDFELKFRYRMLTEGNTGVEIRARADKSGKRPFEGYHADLGHVGIGPGVLGAWDFHFGAGTRKEFPCPRGTRLFIDERGSGRAEKIEGAVSPEDIRRRDWNEVHIMAKGSSFRFVINGKPAAEFTDEIETGRLERGSIALQLHDKGMVVEFKDIRLRKR